MTWRMVGAIAIAVFMVISLIVEATDNTIRDALVLLVATAVYTGLTLLALSLWGYP